MGSICAGLFAVFLAAGSPPEPTVNEGQVLVPSARSGALDLFLVDPETGNTKNVTRTEREEELSPAWSPDGKQIAFTCKTAGTAFEVYVCDADGSNRKRISAVPEHPSGATAPTWSADGKKVAYARGYPGNTYEVRVAAADGSTDEVIREDASMPAWSPNGKAIAFIQHAATGQRGLAVMAPDGTGVKVLVEDIGKVEFCLPAWSPDGKTIVYPADTGYGWQLFLIPATGGTPRQLTYLLGLNFNPVWLTADRLLFTHTVQPGTPGGGYLSMKADGTRLQTHPMSKMEPPHPLIRPTVFLPRAEIAAHAGAETSPVRPAAHTEMAARSSVRVTPVVLIPSTAPGSIFSVAWSEDGKRFAVGLESGSVLVGEFDGKTVRPVEAFRGHEGAVDAVALTADGTTAYSAGADRTVRTWDVGLKGSKAIRTDSAPGRAVAISGDGKLLATGDANGVVKIRDPETGVVAAETQVCDPKRGEVRAVAFGKESEVVFAGCARWDIAVLNGAVVAVDPTTGKQLWRTKGTFGGVFALAVSPDGAKVAGACLDSYVRVWDAKTGAELGCWKGHTDRATGVAWGLGGKTVLSCGFDHTVRVWDAATGTVLHTLATHGSPVVRVAASPDGKHLVSAGQDGWLVVWSLTE